MGVLLGLDIQYFSQDQYLRQSFTFCLCSKLTGLLPKQMPSDLNPQSLEDDLSRGRVFTDGIHVWLLG